MFSCSGPEKAVRHPINNLLAIVLGNFEVLFMKYTSPEEIDLAVKGLSETFKRLNDCECIIDSRT
jgi:hypothetical protein